MMTNEELRLENDRLKVRVSELEDSELKLAEQRIAELEETTRELENRAALMTEQRDAAMWCEEEAKKRIAELEALCLRMWDALPHSSNCASVKSMRRRSGRLEGCDCLLSELRPKMQALKGGGE